MKLALREFVSVCPRVFHACVHVSACALVLCVCVMFVFAVSIFSLISVPHAPVYVYIYMSLNPKPFMASGRVYTFGEKIGFKTLKYMGIPTRVNIRLYCLYIATRVNIRYHYSL